MNKLSKYPHTAADRLWGLIQLMIFVWAIASRDWFLLAAVFVMNTNKSHVILWRGKI